MQLQQIGNEAFKLQKNVQKHHKEVVWTTFFIILLFWNLKASVTHSLNNDRIYNFGGTIPLHFCHTYHGWRIDKIHLP